jgi:hypothetical protein
LNDKQGIAESLVLLGKVARIQGDYAAAQAHLHESLILVRELGDKRALAIGIEEVAALASACGQAERALRLAAAAAGLREAIGHPLTPMEQAELESWLVPARQALSEAIYTAAWEAGQALTLEQAIAAVLDEGS